MRNTWIMSATLQFCVAVRLHRHKINASLQPKVSRWEQTFQTWSWIQEHLMTQKQNDCFILLPSRTRARTKNSRLSSNWVSDRIAKSRTRSFTKTGYTATACQSHKTHSRSQYHSFVKVADHVTKQWRLWRREWPVNGNLGCIFRKSQGRLPFPRVLCQFNQNYMSI